MYIRGFFSKKHQLFIILQNPNKVNPRILCFAFSESPKVT